MKKSLLAILALILVTVFIWWPTLGSKSKNFPGNRTVSEWLSRTAGGSAIPQFEGAPAAASPLPRLPMPTHPVMNNDGYAGAHGDSYNSGVIAAPGPLGQNLTVLSRMTGSLFSGCSTQHFDHKGRVVTVCVGLTESHLLLMDPDDLTILADEELPPMGGWYFRMDQQGRVIVPVGDLSIKAYAVNDGGGDPRWQVEKQHDLTRIIPEEYRENFRTRPMDVVADWEGNWWFSIMEPAIIGFIDTEGGLHAHHFEGEVLENGLAANSDGVYFVTDQHLYGMRAARRGAGVETFMRFAYDAGDSVKALSRGSGTTPVLFGERLIAFGDNADPRPNLLVYRLDDVPDSERLVCKLPVFKAHRSALENSFIGYDQSIVIENNMGWSVFGDSSNGEAGLTRIDVRRDLSGCDTVWENYQVRSGSGGKLSTGSGLIYVHELLADTGPVNAWYITALDFTTGDVTWRKYLGSGKQWDNAMLTLSIGPKGLLTSGMFAGVAAVKDGPPVTDRNSANAITID